MNCPKCHTPFEHPQAERCSECGWSKSKGKPRERQGGIEDCAYVAASGERCHYPGTIWNNTHGVGPGFCRYHWNTEITEALAAAYVLRSRNYRPRTMAERNHDAVFGEPPPAARACQARDCEITTRALPGKDFCKLHQARFERGEEVRVVERPGWIKRIGERAKV